jgi:hypothetical protein
MRLVVIGGIGRIGSLLVAQLNRLGHEAVAAAPQTGVNRSIVASFLLNGGSMISRHHRIVCRWPAGSCRLRSQAARTVICHSTVHWGRSARRLEMAVISGF